MKRIFHISDLHLSKLTLNPIHFFSKRWLGNLNLLLSRRKKFTSEPINAFLQWAKKEKPDYIIITGDLSTTSRSREFEKALHFVKTLERFNIKVLLLPGNHDVYTKKAFAKKLFYTFFPKDPSNEIGVEKVQLDDHLWYIGIDSAIATPLFSSRGLFSIKLEKALHKTLASIPKEDKIILANHFPFYQKGSIRKKLIRKDSLRHLIEEHPNIFLYLHGHIHKHYIADLRSQELPISTDSGSLGHVHKGSFNDIMIYDDHLTIRKIAWNKQKIQFEKSYKREYPL
ncbi:MAG TPA: metallophosphoesterase [Chlamydiales bacterium]|nr:metallophosphoesterase [Chlamydiales bacterium]